MSYQMDHMPKILLPSTDENKISKINKYEYSDKT